MIVGIGCWRGTGATTTALLLATALAETGTPSWLVEADPVGGVLAARCGLRVDDLGGRDGIGVELLARRRAAVSDSGGDVDDAFAAAAVTIGGVGLVPMPADPFRAHVCVGAGAWWIEAMRVLRRPVVVDVGRLRPGLSSAVLERLDLLLVVTSAEATALVATDDWVEIGGRVSPSDPGHRAGLVRLVVVDSPVAGTSFSRAVASAELGDRLAGWIPWSPGGVELLHCGVGLVDRRARRRGFAAAARHLAAAVADVVGEPAARAQEVGA